MDSERIYDQMFIPVGKMAKSVMVIISHKSRRISPYIESVKAFTRPSLSSGMTDQPENFTW